MNKKIIITASLLVLILAAIGGWTFSGAGNTIKLIVRSAC